jgi:hypothetical protein
MKRSITKNLAAVSFHDSSIERFERREDTITLTFDWAKIGDEETPLVIGGCRLHLFQVASSEISPAQHGIECMGAQYSLIGTNSSKTDNDLELGGFYQSPEEYSWIDWKCRFASFQLEWDSEVTLEEWRSGKLPGV